MDEGVLSRARAVFLEDVGEFRSFRNDESRFAEEEDRYKRDAVVQAHALLGPLVDGGPQPSTDERARELLCRVFELMNFHSWRDRARIDELLAEEGDWVEFLRLIVACLGDSPDGPWRERLAEVLAALAERGCPANLTKILPTFFLFLWDPEHHFCMKGLGAGQISRHRRGGEDWLRRSIVGR